jgi:hypothetical protein
MGRFGLKEAFAVGLTTVAAPALAAGGDEPFPFGLDVRYHLGQAVGFSSDGIHTSDSDEISGRNKRLVRKEKRAVRALGRAVEAVDGALLGEECRMLITPKDGHVHVLYSDDVCGDADAAGDCEDKEHPPVLLSVKAFFNVGLEDRHVVSGATGLDECLDRLELPDGCEADPDDFYAPLFYGEGLRPDGQPDFSDFGSRIMGTEVLSVECFPRT